MWTRFVAFLRCPVCRGRLDVSSFDEVPCSVSRDDERLAAQLGLLGADFARYIETGLLLCYRCRAWFPIFHGVPILLPYLTPAHEEFRASFQKSMARIASQYHFPVRRPVAGEQSAMASFSEEWRHYRYDGVIWELSYRDHEVRFLREVGLSQHAHLHGPFLEVGCGLGITTYLAYKNYRVDAVGVDLSAAVLKASEHYRKIPFLHFVQASAFALPFEVASFDILYSRGVLHHTYSTQEAFRSIAPYCRPAGHIYVWVYGRDSVNGSPLRRVLYGIETVVRPLLSRQSRALATICLAPVALGYMCFNTLRRLVNSQIQALTYARGLHAARDRFTPRYAHRHQPQDVVSWFESAGFERIDIVDWRTMPAADQSDFRRNIGIRARRPSTAGHSSDVSYAAAR